MEMDRFSQLEFDETNPQKRTSFGEPIRDAKYFFNEALKYWLASEPELALRNYSRVLEQDHTCCEAWGGQVNMLIELGEYREAMIWADKGLDMFPEHPDLLASKAIACIRDERKGEALAYSDNAVGKNNASARVWLARAEVMLIRNKTIAEQCICKAVSFAGKMAPYIKIEAAQLLQRMHSYSAAMKYLNEAVQLLPKAPLVWYELGVCQYRLGLPQAKASFEQCLHLKPGWKKAKQALNKACKNGFFRRLFRG